jgi:hypothetical protein
MNWCEIDTDFGTNNSTVIRFDSEHSIFESLARVRDGESRNLSNVYNYLIIYKKNIVENVTAPKNGEKKSSGSIFRKGLFRKSEKDHKK